MTGAYYNENDPKAAAWLRELIKVNAIAPGEVDDRSILDVVPAELAGFTQCHFFAGIGVWSYALRLAGWPDDRVVWTGSCPCQPFSAAGKGDGFADERHLWPYWFHLIEQRRPAVLYGEQVASKNADPWIDLVQDDLEALGYAFGAVPFPAAGIGAPQLRDRTYWLARSSGERLAGERLRIQPGTPRLNHAEAGRHSEVSCVAGANDTERRADGAGRDDGDRSHTRRPQGSSDTEGCCELGIAAGSGRERLRYQPAHGEPVQAGPVNGAWRAADWIYCRDEKYRPVEPGTFPLAHGAPARVGRLRGYGNAIVAEAAAEFIGASLALSPRGDAND